MMNRRSLIPTLAGLTVASVANATGVKPKPCECKDGKNGKDGKDGRNGDKGDKGDPGICPPKEIKSVLADFEIQVLGVNIPTPEFVINTPTNGAFNDELWYFPQWDAAIFFDYNREDGPHFIAFKVGRWAKITPMGIRMWNFHIYNPATQRNHVCTISLDKLLNKPGAIYQTWTKLVPMAGSF